MQLRDFGGSHLCRGALAAAVIVACASSVTHAASVNYGNYSFPPSPVSLLNVTESSATDPVPLYGPPAPFQIGLSFSPTGFAASGVNGTADITDGQLNFTITSLTPSAAAGINTLSLFEGGDFTLVGVGTAATSAIAGAIISVRVTEIDGVPVAPIQLSPGSASVGFSLLSNPGIVQPWSLGISLSIASQLAASNIPFTIGATKVEVAIDNSLVALSEAGSVAFIAKKNFGITVIPGDTVLMPEPGGMAMTGSLVSGLALRRRQRV